MAGKGSQKASKDARILSTSNSPKALKSAGKGLNNHKNQSHKKP
jgi:hypothetical protein